MNGDVNLSEASWQRIQSGQVLLLVNNSVHGCNSSTLPCRGRNCRWLNLCIARLPTHLWLWRGTYDAIPGARRRWPCTQWKVATRRCKDSSRRPPAQESARSLSICRTLFLSGHRPNRSDGPYRQWWDLWWTPSAVLWCHTNGAQDGLICSTSQDRCWQFRPRRLWAYWTPLPTARMSPAPPEGGISLCRVSSSASCSAASHPWQAWLFRGFSLRDGRRGYAQRTANQGLTGKQSVAGLLKIISFRAVVNIFSDFVQSGKRMKHPEVVARAVKHILGEAVAVFHPFVLIQVGKTLSLHTGHIQYVGGVYNRWRQLCMHLVGDAKAVAQVKVLLRHCQLGAWDKTEFRVEIPHCHQQGMHRAAILEVSHHCYLKIVKLALGLKNRVEVKHCLRRMLVWPVAGIYHRRLSHRRGILGRAFLIMAHDDEVDIVWHHLYGVFQRLTFWGRGCAGIWKTNHTAAKTIYCSLKT